MSRKDGEISCNNDLVSYKDILDMISGPGFKKIATSEYNNTIFMLRIQEVGLDDANKLLNLVKKEIE
ncbi:hypothetical protein [Seonamhaeicola maritimus]|uniref:hypothetical protein n=1 Tax=Seonamhaeicola maritimus TaxID=2591822 RepID=UPI00249529C3|nr:hypothetical protein [Seonamhaeicola maritimus]